MSITRKVFIICIFSAFVGQAVTYAIDPYVRAAIHPFFAQATTPTLDYLAQQCAGYFALENSGASGNAIGEWALAHPECLAAINAALQK